VNHNEQGINLSPEKAPDAKQIVTRSQPFRKNQVADPAGPDRPRPIRTSVQVKAAAARKAQLELELKELNEQKVQAMAEMDAQEELKDEEEERTRTSAANTTSMDEVDDINEESSGKERENGRSDFVGDGEGSQEEGQLTTKVFAKQSSVRSSFWLIICCPVLKQLECAEEEKTSKRRSSTGS
jgi:hypothetical protein